ncbi:MAG: prolyl oligopeptidase family serine peptidase [Isosphaeraceae bacterium]|nr:prolyl oligopeptidase family serine peptidase [Isosphaeraceae bacterium]
MRLRLLTPLLILGLTAAPARADGPADNRPDAVRQVPKPGIELDPKDREALEAGLRDLGAAIERLQAVREEATRELLPDVQIFHKAVHDALTYREFFAREDIARAKDLLKEGRERAEQLARGEAPWAAQTGLVVRGYRSRIDGSVQPYGLVVPVSYAPKGSGGYRLDLWFHGRGETLSEVNFLAERRRQPGQFTPPDTIVLHPYGRFCNANKFAGEVDVLEALDSVRRRYRIDEDRIAVRGFSMGGAACWQFAVHYADRWFAANPGAGFAETPRFLQVFQKETLQPTWYERKLWHLYDCTDVAVNLAQCPTVAYSGELDLQKQAADVMAEALAAEGIELVHILGPGTKHAYHPEAKHEVERRLASLAAKGRQRVPRSVRFDTYTLRYNRMNWVTVDALGEHWEKARVRAHVRGDSGIAVETANVQALTLEFPPGWCPFDLSQPVEVAIDGATLDGPRPLSDRSWRLALHREGRTWKPGPLPEDRPRKRHGLQGPIDDAFMDTFLFVRPTGQSPHDRVAGWVQAELDRAVVRWRRQFRGEALIKEDTEVTDEEIARANLVLWGDPASNAIMRRIADKLPIRWEKDRIAVGDRSFDAATHALILIAPNPLNPKRYVVLNSGFTYREYDDLNNARQVPRLPDWAVVDVRTPPSSRFPGQVVTADFFDENWTLKPGRR